jgi:hypothetical protein
MYWHRTGMKRLTLRERSLYTRPSTRAPKTEMNGGATELPEEGLGRGECRGSKVEDLPRDSSLRRRA